MIVFTIKNSRTDIVYIGTTKDSVDERWAQLQLAKDHGLESALYDDMRNYGIACFSIEEYDYAETREELNEMFSEAMTQYNGVSLKGMKMAIPRTAIYVTNEGREIDTRIASPSKAAKSAKADKEAEASISVSTSSSSAVRKTSTTSVTSQTAKRKAQLENDLNALKEKPKLATGRTGSAIKEKRIKEAIALEKLEREALKKRQVNEQADEMKAILANLDARGSTLRKRY